MNTKIYTAMFAVILLTAFFFRFWNYSGRYGLAYDQAHDAIIAREAVQNRLVPLVGPFSSAGPFQTSGTWYWLLMLPTFFYSDSILTPWIFLTFSGFLMVLGIGIFGTYLAGRTFGLIVALLTAVSTAQIAQSVNLTNQTPIPYISFLALASSVIFLRNKKYVYMALTGFLVSLAASIHLQGMALCIVIAVALVLHWRIIVRSSLSALAGFIWPMLPIIMWDIPRGFRNIHNMIYYYRYDQFNISLDVLGRRWLTYLSDFWPREWSHITGGFSWIGYLIAAMMICTCLYHIKKRSLTREWVLLCMSFLGMMIVVRYTHVPIFSSFITFMHPIVLILTAWSIHTVVKLNKTVGLLLLLIIVSGSVVKSSREAFLPRQNFTAKTSLEIRAKLKNLYPGEKFMIYDYNYEEVTRSVPIVLFLDEENLLSESGRKIGFLRQNHQGMFNTDIISTTSGLIADLSASNSGQLIRDGWIGVNPSDIYKSTAEWLPKNK